MFKTTTIALIAVTSLFAVAAPAFAAESSFGGDRDNATDGSSETGSKNDQNEDVSSRAFLAHSLVARLQEQGINATSVESWGGLVRAEVIDADGRQTTQFFTPDTLTQVVL
jgi:hypothetical protein